MNITPHVVSIQKYDWQIIDNMLEPNWYPTNAVPYSLSGDYDNTDETLINMAHQVLVDQPILSRPLFNCTQGNSRHTVLLVQS